MIMFRYALCVISVLYITYCYDNIVNACTRD